MGKTKYKEEWKEQFAWIQRVNADCYSAFVRSVCDNLRLIVVVFVRSGLMLDATRMKNH